MRVGESALAQPGQVGDGGLAAGQHDDVGVGQIGGVGDPAHQHAGLAGQRLDVGGVGDARQPDRGHPQPVAAARRLRAADDAMRPAPTRESSASSHSPSANGHDAVGRPAGQGLQLRQPGRQQGGIAAELVDHESRDQPLVLGFEHRDGAEQVRQQSAAVDVADHDDRQLRGPGQPHVGQIGCAQVDLGG